MFESIIHWLKEVWNDFKPLYFIPQYEYGVMFRLGLFKKILPPGPHFRIPFIDDIITQIVTTDTINIAVINITTKDNKTISISATIKFRITDIYKYLVLTNNARDNLHDICRGFISDYLEELTWDEVKLKKTKTYILNKLIKEGDTVGVTIESFMFTDKCISQVLRLFNEGSSNIVPSVQNQYQ